MFILRKKTILSSIMITAMALSLGSLFAAPSLAVCPVKSPCAKQCEKTVKPECQKPMPIYPNEHAKMHEQKKTEFEARLNLTDEQKAKLEKIKADEKKALAPYQAKIRQEEQKIDELFEKEKAVRKESLKKFESLLTEEQKTELNKIKEEIKTEMEKMAPKEPPFMGHKKPCPTDCKCKCHNEETKSPEPADCKCPCHKPQQCLEPQAVK